MEKKIPTHIPEPLRGSEEGSFAQSTVAVRLPAIGKRILEENDFPEWIQVRLQGLLSGLPMGHIRLLDDPGAPDLQGWNKILEAYEGQDWLQIPWFLAETCFYRRVLEATRYFQPGPTFGYDPYHYQKGQGLTSFHEPIREACSRIVHDLEISSPSRWDLLAEWIFLNLWGNQVDLSMWPAGHANRPDHPAVSRRQHLLCDHTSLVIEYLARLDSPIRRLDFVLDNAGLELVYDLLLADFLLEGDFTSTVHFHVKSHPTFVSDAMLKDFNQTISYLFDSPDSTVHSVGARLQDLVTAGRLRVCDHFYWTSPLSAWEMPEDLSQDLMQSDLLISKGDANYRRFLGDRHWAFDTPLQAVLAYLPLPWLGLRISKSQVMIGLKSGQADELSALELDWLTNGRWGLIQFFNPQNKG